MAALWAIHGVHHQSDRFNISIAIRHPWFSDSYSAIFYAPLPLLGVSTTQFFLAISVISFYALTVHSQTFHRPGFYIFVTPRTHIVHHSRNPRYLGKNLGAMFTIWDRMFGTHVELDPNDPPELGTPGGYETHDGVKAQWIYFRDILASAAAGKTLRDKVMAFVGRPGWRPAGAKLPPSPAARAESTVSAAVKAYVLVQFGVTLALSVYVLWLREQHTFAVLALAAVAVLFSLSTIGGVLDGRARAAGWELGRHGVFAVVGVALTWLAGYELVGGEPGGCRRRRHGLGGGVVGSVRAAGDRDLADAFADRRGLTGLRPHGERHLRPRLLRQLRRRHGLLQLVDARQRVLADHLVQTCRVQVVGVAPRRCGARLTGDDVLKLLHGSPRPRVHRRIAVGTVLAAWVTRPES